MSSDSQVYREEFDTEAEAIAFTEGLEFMLSSIPGDTFYGDMRHLVMWESPYEESDKWVVEVTKFC